MTATRTIYLSSCGVKRPRRAPTVASVVGLALIAGAPLTGCGDAGLGGLFGAGGGQLIIRGTMTVVENEGVCPVFQADDGFSYHLRQGTNLANDLFDAVTQIGAVSRLSVSVRNDLPVACQFGTVVVVVDVLELISPDGSTLPLEEPEPDEDSQGDTQPSGSGETEGSGANQNPAEGGASDEG